MTQSHVTVLAELRLLPNCIEQGKRDLLKFANTVRRKESDCLAIELLQDLDDPTRVTLKEVWKDRGAYEGPHLKTSHMQAFIEKSSQYFDGAAHVSFCNGTRVGADRSDTEPRAGAWRRAPYGR